MFSAMVPGKMTLSWVTMLIWLRRLLSVQSRMSIAVDQNAAFLGIVKSREQCQQRRFAAAVAAHDRHAFALGTDRLTSITAG